MDFVHNPYRCGPLRVGMYGHDPAVKLSSWSLSHISQHLIYFTTIIVSIVDSALAVFRRLAI